MGLKLAEAFVDIAYFITAAGAEITGASPTCTIYDEANNTAAGVVAEIANGLYSCSFTPDIAGIWKLRWRLLYLGDNYGATHIFQAGQGQEADIFLDTTDLMTFEWQANAELDQAPASGVKYEVLATSANVRIYEVSARCTWTVQPDPLECHVTVDGNALIGSKFTPATNTWYYLWYRGVTADTLELLSSANRYRAFVMEGRSVKVEAEITGGTVSRLQMIVVYGMR